VTTYVLIHGGGGSAWDWHLLVPELRARGHDAVAMDLPSEDPSAGLSEYADAVVEVVGERTGLVVVAHSLGGFTAPLVCERVPVDQLVLVAAMVPSPGETGGDWWANTGHGEAFREQPDHDGSEDAVVYHDVPPKLAAWAGQPREGGRRLKVGADNTTRFKKRKPAAQRNGGIRSMQGVCT